jgi:hypothetical protein
VSRPESQPESQRESQRESHLGPRARSAALCVSVPGRLRAGALLGLLGLLGGLASACDRTGTIAVTLVSAPDSDVLEDVVRARLTLTQPRTVVEAERDAGGGLALVLDVPAGDAQGDLVLEGFDADGALIAYGRSGPLPIGGITIDIALYAAPPMSLAETPAPLDTPRSDMGVATLSYGAFLAGGRETNGTASAAVEIYSVYQHVFQELKPLPSARVAPATASGARDRVYLFGGLNASGAPSASLYGFDPGASGGGSSFELATVDTALARAGVAMAALGNERFAVTGAPPVLVDATQGLASALPDAPALAGTATSGVTDGAVLTLFAGAGSGATGAVLLTDDRFTELEPPLVDGVNPMWRTNHATALLPDGSMLVLGGRIDTAQGPLWLASAVRVRLGGGQAEGEFEVIELLATPREHAAVAANEQHVVIAGGVDENGALVGDAEVFDSETLAPVAVLSMVSPRTRAAAVPLPNGQILIVGGVDGAGEPVGKAELFTPGP